MNSELYKPQFTGSALSKLIGISVTQFNTLRNCKLLETKDRYSLQDVFYVAFCNDLPQSERELSLISENAHLLENATIAVAYTVWSRKRGAGKEIVAKLKQHIIEKTDIERIVTLSPLTPMAAHFHISNGAKLVQYNATTQNFEYKLDK